MRKKKTRARKKARKKFRVSGPQSILDFVRAGGTPTTAQINKNWKGQGRTGSANVMIGKLIKTGKLKREPIKGERGSRHQAL